MNDRYVANSRASKEALKSANLLKTININALITGESGVGKKKLARYIIDAPIIDGTEFDEVILQISKNTGLIIKNFDKIKNYDKLEESLKKHKTRILATSQKELKESIEDRFFSLKIYLPPLREREEDVKSLIEIFLNEAREVFDDESSKRMEITDVDLSKNCYSLRKSVYKSYLFSKISEDEIMDLMESFLTERLGNGNDYRDFLHLFELPLIRAGFKRFNSQLLMSKEFGLNRNTLRKKINEYKDKL